MPSVKTILTQKNLIIISLLAIFSIITLWLRLLPSADLVSPETINLLGNDPWYALRQIEVTVRHFPAYGWFDAMTEFPYGNVTGWGPLFIQIISFIAILLGSSTRYDLMLVASFIPPMMAVVMVPVVFLIGKTVANWKTGLIASGLVAIVSGQYFYRSLFGFVDHHIAEVLFSTIFSLSYILVLSYTSSHPVDFKRKETLHLPVIYAILSGVAYLLGLFTMPTMILFALIVSVFTFIQYNINFVKNRASDSLLLINVLTFGIVIFGLFLFGIQHPNTTSLARYSIGHIIVYLAIIFGTITLWTASRLLHGRPKYYYPITLIGLGILVSVILFAVSSSLFNILVGNFFSFFGETSTTLTIQEARPWNAGDAWNIFNFGLLLMVGGFGSIIYQNIKKERPDQMFVLVWSAIVLLSTILHIRYEYYLGVNIALLSAIGIGTFLEFGWGEAIATVTKRKQIEADVVSKPEKKKKKGAEKKTKVKSRTHPDYLKLGVVALTLVLTILFVEFSLSTDLTIGGNVGRSAMNDDWREALEWMHDNTPETGVDYYAIYERDTFEYPPEAYGVMSWWDYGHWITYIANRIPNANPFQHGVRGANGSASFFMYQSEADSSAILDRLDTRYVITDIEMDTGKFWAMATWYNETTGVSPYQKQAYSQQYQPVTVYTGDYFHTMISKLHNFDGSMTVADDTFVSTYQGIKVSPLFIAPVDTIPALRHYRLVHESPSNVFNSPNIDLKYVKIFEYVPGARILGEGIITVTIETDQGRLFVYRQESENGEFIVPYSTTGNTYGVKTQGNYRIEGTNLMFEVPEEAVLNGLLIA